MKHARDDYNRIQDPLGKIPEDEPVFLFRGQDSFSPIILRYYSRLTKDYGLNEISKLASDHADAMEKWQNKNIRKLPDL